MSYINGDLYFAHIKEVEGGKYFALEKPNDSNLLCIVISSTWRWHAAILAVAESSEDVTKFSLNYYTDLMQFTGYRDRATRRAQVLRLLLIDRVGVDPSNPLVVIQLDITGTNTICSIERQLQLDVLARKASRTCGGSRVLDVMVLPCPSSLDKHWDSFQSMPGVASIMCFSDNQDNTHHLPCSKGGAARR